MGNEPGHLRFDSAGIVRCLKLAFGWLENSVDAIGVNSSPGSVRFAADQPAPVRRKKQVGRNLAT